MELCLRGFDSNKGSFEQFSWVIEGDGPGMVVKNKKSVHVGSKTFQMSQRAIAHWPIGSVALLYDIYMTLCYLCAL